MPAKKAATPKITDVAHPDSVKTDPTSVPIIVKHGPILKDPMVAPEAPADKTEDKKAEASPVVTKIELKPISADEGKIKTPAAKVETAKPEKDVKPAEQPEPETEPVEPEKAEEKPTTEPEPAPEPDEPMEPEKPAETESDTTKEVPADSEELLPGAEPTDPAAAKAAREAAEKQLALDKLASEGTYFLPINAVEKRRVRTVLITLLVLIVLGAAGFLAALDGGYLHIDGLSAPTDFIKN